MIQIIPGPTLVFRFQQSKFLHVILIILLASLISLHTGLAHPHHNTDGQLDQFYQSILLELQVRNKLKENSSFSYKNPSPIPLYQQYVSIVSINFLTAGEPFQEHLIKGWFKKRQIFSILDN